MKMEQEKRSREVVAWARLGLVVLALRIGERGSEPRNVSSLERLEKIRKYILLWSLYKECSSADALFLVHSGPF